MLNDNDRGTVFKPPLCVGKEEMEDIVMGFIPLITKLYPFQGSRIICDNRL